MPTVQSDFVYTYIILGAKNFLINNAIRNLALAFEWVVTLGVGYEINKMFDGNFWHKDVWAFVEFFVVIFACVCIWIVKCCCINKFCINFWCLRHCNKKSNEAEEIEMRNDQSTLPVGENANKGPLNAVLDKLHMVLNRLAIGAVGYELRKQLFKMKPLTTWDYVEISVVILFCLWILSIKYCILKCYCLRCCCCGFRLCRSKNANVAQPQNAPANDNTAANA